MAWLLHPITQRTHQNAFQVHHILQNMHICIDTARTMTVQNHRLYMYIFPAINYLCAIYLSRGLRRVGEHSPSSQSACCVAIVWRRSICSCFSSRLPTQRTRVTTSTLQHKYVYCTRTDAFFLLCLCVFVCIFVIVRREALHVHALFSTHTY